MTFFDQLFNLPYAVFWLPGTVFMAIVGFTYWFVRPRPLASVVGESTQAGTEQPALTAKPAPEQRAAFRRAGNPVQVHIATPDDKSSPVHGCVLDRSVGGMRLAVYEEVESGTVLSIRPLRADSMVPWIDLEVRSCCISAEMTGQFELGCKYVKTPPYSLQLIFG